MKAGDPMLIEMKNVALTKNQKTIVRNIDWLVEEGQHWAILGMNGAGKTTLLNLVCGYLYPSDGSIKLFGKTFGQFPLNELRKEIGWVSASFSEKMKHHPYDTAYEMVLSGKYASIGLYEQPDEKDLARASELIAYLGIEKNKNQTFQSLSQGEKQRVLIGRALMASPRLLILDEPCAGLDFLSKAQLLHTIENMASAQKTTILYVTHQIDEILPIFTRSLLLREGEVFSRGPTKEQLTSENLSAFCKSPVGVSESNNRYFLDEVNVHA
jgi:iron complex transport system ATP-binding protein